MKTLFYIFLFLIINAFCQITLNLGTKGINAQSTFWLGSLNNQPLNIRTNNIQRATILANGNFGIGTANLTNASNQIAIGFRAVGAGSNSVALGNDNIAKTVLKGNVGIGTTSPTSKLDINGSFSSTVPVFTTSAILNATHNCILVNNIRKLKN